MKIERLREFLVLAEKLNFTRAAQKLNITQPVLSRHMKELEMFFGMPLLCRDTHQVELTSAGRLMADEARKILCQYDNFVSTILTFTGQSRRKLSVAFLGEMISSQLVELVENFRQKHQDIGIDCLDCELDEAQMMLSNGLVDFAFLLRPDFLAQNDDFASLPFATDPLCVAVNRYHPLAGRKRVSIREVADWPIMRIDPRDFALSELYSTQFLNRHGLDFTLYKEYPNLKTCCFDLELNNRGVLLIPKHRCYLLGSNSVLLELAEHDCCFSLEMAWSRNTVNSCVNLFVNEFKNYFASTQPLVATRAFNNDRRECQSESVTHASVGDGCPAE